MENNTFEIGDKVRVIGLTDVYAGRCGEVVDHLENGVNYRVKLDLGNNHMHRIYHADELELWKPAEPDEYTRDGEQARLLARIRELEEGYEAILSELVVARPFNDILDDVRAIAQRMLYAEDGKPEPKTTRHYVTVMPSIGDKVRIRKGAEQDTEYLINAQKLGTVGVIVGFDRLDVNVEFGSGEEDTWMLAFSELEIVELNPRSHQALADEPVKSGE